MTTQDRIREYCKLKEISIHQFEIQAGLSNGYVSSMRKGIGINKLEDVLNAFPDINRDWLLYGEGNMLLGPYDRINKILELEGLSQRDFEKGTGELSSLVPAIYKTGIYKNAQKNPGNPIALKQWVDSVLKRFPRYSEEWILYGTPPMMRDEAMLNGKEQPVQKVPVFEFEATAGFSALYRDLSSSASDYISIPNLPPVDGAIYARGDSMSPLIESGDIIIFKKVELHPDNIIWGSIYIISYTLDGDDYTVLKYIRHSSRDGYIRLESYNPRFDPQDIPSSSITALALVKASITFHTIG
jgi:hypothetical protein